MKLLLLKLLTALIFLSAVSAELAKYYFLGVEGKNFFVTLKLCEEVVRRLSQNKKWTSRFLNQPKVAFVNLKAK